MTEIDVIILSYAHNDALKITTKNCIESLINSENPKLIKFNIIVIESESRLKPFQFDFTSTIYPHEDFGYHRYMNIGIHQTRSPFICICNNDLIFHKNWASEILKPFELYTDVYSASPLCPNLHASIGVMPNTGLRIGYRVRNEICGWCLFFRRDLFKIIGQLDPNYNFWCADNDYANTLWVLRLNHVLVTSSIVDHLESITLNEQSDSKQLELTEGESVYHSKKWDPKRGEKWTIL